jgi:hypothetical protein
MKKIFLAFFGLIASVSAWAQVTDSTSYNKTSTDTTTQTTMSPDSTKTSVGMTSTDTTATGSSTAVVTDEDLRKYAMAIDSVEYLKKDLLREISAMVKGNGKIKVARYNELNKASADSTKLDELKATPEERAFLKQVSEKKAAGVQHISDVVDSLANSYVGVEVYNRIKTQLDVDSGLKSRYEKILAEVKAESAKRRPEAAESKSTTGDKAGSGKTSGTGKTSTGKSPGAKTSGSSKTSTGSASGTTGTTK